MKTLIHTSQIPSLKEKKEVFPYHKTAYGVTLGILSTLFSLLLPLTAKAAVFDSFTGTVNNYNNGYVPGASGSVPWTGTGTVAYVRFYAGVYNSSSGSGRLRLLTQVGGSMDCYSPFYSDVVNDIGAKANWWNGSGSAHPEDMNLVIVPVSGTQCNITSGDTSYFSWVSTSGNINHAANAGTGLFELADSGGFPPADTSTRIIDLAPHEGDQVGSATSISAQLVTFALHAYINPDDVGFFIGIDVTLENLDRNVAILNVIGTSISPNTTVFLDHVVATTTGDFYYTVQKYVPNGTYTVHAELTKAIKDLYGNSLFANPFFDVDDVSHNFIVAMQTSQGALYTNLYKTLNDIASSTTATTTQASARTCNPVSGYFDILSCGQFLFTPNADSLKDINTSFQTNLFNRAPWGYVTRFVSIMASTTAIEPVPISYTFGSSSPSVLQGKTYTINIFDEDNLNKVSTIYTDDGQHKNIWDIVNPYFNMVVNVAILLMILSDILGFDYGIFKSKDPWSKSETQSTTIGIDRNHKRYDTSATTVSRRRKLP